LRDPQKGTQTLTQLVKFLDLPVATLDGGAPAIIRDQNRNAGRGSGSLSAVRTGHVDPVRIKCAFELAEIETRPWFPNVMAKVRPIIATNNRTSNAGKDGAGIITADDVYDWTTVCEMWKVFGVHAKKQGYVAYKGFNCTDVV
jgi:hypothetical protein